jgi:hypothetical protein
VQPDAAGTQRDGGYRECRRSAGREAVVDGDGIHLARSE